MKQLTKKQLQENDIELIEKDEVFTQFPRYINYFISNKGRLIHKNKKERLNIVNPSITTGGYLTYTLSKPARTYKGQKVRDANGKPKNQRETKSANNMVCLLYCVNPYPAADYSMDDLEAHHKDGDRKNNYSSNLMWLCKEKNGRQDHDFIHSIKKVAYYNRDKGTFRGYKDIEKLLKRLNVNVLEFIDTIRDSDRLFVYEHWDIYQINNHFIGVQFYTNQKKKI